MLRDAKMASDIVYNSPNDHNYLFNQQGFSRCSRTVITTASTERSSIVSS
jgi:hypothetical protein